MKHLFNEKILNILTIFLVLALIVKTIWFVIEILWLPSQGISYETEHNAKPLYYRVKLTPNKAKAPVIEKKPVFVQETNMKDIKLLAIYNASDATVVTVSSKGKTKVLSRGEDINGFVLEGAHANYAMFSKKSKIYKIMLFNPKGKNKLSTITTVTPSVSSRKADTSEISGEVTDLGDHKVIDRALFDHYTNHMDDIYKNIGITEVKDGKSLKGFRLTFVRKDSPFSKLGVRRDDIIKSINGQEITSYNAAFEIYKNLKNTENLSLGIKRGKEDMELEYEIN